MHRPAGEQHLVDGREDEGHAGRVVCRGILEAMAVAAQAASQFGNAPPIL
jgi:hypothetical protein